MQKSITRVQYINSLRDKVSDFLDHESSGVIREYTYQNPCGDVDHCAVGALMTEEQLEYIASNGYNSYAFQRVLKSNRPLFSNMTDIASVKFIEGIQECNDTIDDLMELGGISSALGCEILASIKRHIPTEDIEALTAFDKLRNDLDNC